MAIEPEATPTAAADGNVVVVPRFHRRRGAGFETLTDQDRAAIVDAYTNHDARPNTLATRYRVSASSIYRILHDEGTPLKHPEFAHRNRTDPAGDGKHVWTVRFVTETQVRANTFDLAIATARRNGAVEIVACMQDD
ncbi:MAG: hypothetical protein JOY61_04390 [Chloroflexi bacterium]|nr:hypothetical protein [Chloroflexota bacterium]